jgi:hypothetical protein
MKCLGDLGAIVEAAHADWLKKADMCAMCFDLAHLSAKGTCWTCEAAEESERIAAARADSLGRGMPGAWEVPARYRWACVESEQWTERVRVPVATVRRVVAAKPPGLYIVGPAGAGKTCAAVAMGRAAYPRGMAFAQAVRLSGQGFAAPEELLAAPCVLIDDLGSEKRMSSSLIADVIHERHARDMPIWVTSAIEPRDMATQYGDGVARRLLENGMIIRAQ